VQHVAGTFFAAAFFLGAAFLAARMMGLELTVTSAREDGAVAKAVGFLIEGEVG